MKTLNRIDRSFIFQEFVQTCPTIQILDKNTIYKFTSADYKIVNNEIELIKKTSILVGSFTLLFAHKERLISAQVQIQRAQGSSFFVFPSKLELYDNLGETKNFSATLVLSPANSDEAPKSLPVSILEECPLFHFEEDFLLEQKNAELLAQVRSMLKYQNNRVNEFCVNRLYFFLEKLAEGSLQSASRIDLSKRINLLFLSERFALFFVSEQVLRVFSTITEKELALKIGSRFINMRLGQSAGHMQINQNTPNNTTMSLVVLSTEGVSIEDKRFLYEIVYRLKYGTVK